MALADNLGSAATIESETNFFAVVPAGDTAYAESTVLVRRGVAARCMPAASHV